MQKTFKGIGTIGFIISAIFTVVLWVGSSSDIFIQGVLLCVGIIFELSKLSLAYVGMHGTIDGKKLKQSLKYSAIAGSILCFVISIVASLSFLANSSQEEKQQALENSKEYSARQEQIKIQDDLYNSKKNEIDVLQNQADSWPKNYVSKRQETLNMKGEKEIELSTMGNKLQELKDLSTITIDPTENTQGFKGLCARLCKWINTNPKFKKSPLSPSDVEYYFFAACAILFDFIALLCYMLGEGNGFKTENGKTVSNVYDTKVPEKPKTIIDEKELRRLLHEQYKKFGDAEVMEVDAGAKKDSPIGFKFDETLCRTEVLDYNKYVEYLEYVINNRLSGSRSPGTNKILNNTNLSLTEIRSIRDLLKDLRILEVDQSERNTKILVNTLQEATNILNPLFNITV